MGGSASYRYGKKISAAMAAGESEEKINELKRQREEAIIQEKMRRAEREGTITTKSNSIVAGALGVIAMKQTVDYLMSSTNSSSKKSSSSKRSNYDDEGEVMSEKEWEELRKKEDESVLRIHEEFRKQEEREAEQRRRWEESEEGKKMRAALDAEHKFEKEHGRASFGYGDVSAYFGDDAKKLAEQYLKEVVVHETSSNNINDYEIVPDNEYGGYRLRDKRDNTDFPQLFMNKADKEKYNAIVHAKREADYQKYQAEKRAKQQAEEQKKQGKKSLISRLFGRK